MRAWCCYARATLWKLRGVQVGRRVSIGRRCSVLRPWRVIIGDHATFEHQVWLKLVDDYASTKIGRYTFLGAGTELDVLQRVEIGDHTLIAPGCFITDHDHGTALEQRIDQQPCAVDPVSIGSDVWIGAKACILKGVSIGDGAIVGAAAVVCQNVAPGAIVAGVPARQIGWRE